MDQDKLNLLIKEFSGAVEHWTDFGLSTVNRNYELNLRNSEREFNLILNMSTLAAAFLAIALPIAEKFATSGMINVITILFLGSSILGVFSLLITIQRDKEHIQKDYDWEYGLVKGYLEQAIEIRDSLYEFNKNKSLTLLPIITDRINKYFEERKKLKIEADQRKIKKEKEILT